MYSLYDAVRVLIIGRFRQHRRARVLSDIRVAMDVH